MTVCAPLLFAVIQVVIIHHLQLGVRAECCHSCRRITGVFNLFPDPQGRNRNPGPGIESQPALTCLAHVSHLPSPRL